MADLDITKNVLANQRHVIPGDPEAATYANAVHTAGHSISSMIPELTGAGYTVEQINKMTKNDMIFALREVNDLTYQPE